MYSFSFYRLIVVILLFLSIFFLPLITAVKILSFFLLILYMYICFSNKIILDLMEGGLFLGRRFYLVQNFTVSVHRFGLFKVIVVRLNKVKFLILNDFFYGDLESNIELLRKYQNNYFGGAQFGAAKETISHQN